MKTTLDSNVGPKPGEITSLSVLFARLTWAAAGPGALLLLSIAIISRGTGWMTVLDLLFAVVVGLMALGRWVEQRSGAATTLTGTPSSMADTKRYIAILIPAAACIWAVANLLGNHLLA